MVRVVDQTACRRYDLQLVVKEADIHTAYCIRICLYDLLTYLHVLGANRGQQTFRVKNCLNDVHKEMSPLKLPYTA